MHSDTKKYNAALAAGDRAICDLLAKQIDLGLPDAENKIWHAHPVWFLDGIQSLATASSSTACASCFGVASPLSKVGLPKKAAFKRRKRATPRWIRSTPRS